MTRSIYLISAAVLATALLAFAAGCGGGGDAKQVALLVPGAQTSRNEGTIRPNFEERLLKGCEGCEVVYRDGGGKVDKQKQQAKAVLDEGVAVLVINPVYSEYGAGIVKEAEEKEIPVVVYGQTIDGAKPTAFVSYDYKRNGELQTETLAKRIKQEGRPRGPVVMVNGEPANPDEHLFQEGARQGLQAAGVRIEGPYFTPFWQASQAKREMGRAIDKLGANGFAGAYTETDGIAEGAIEAMKEAGIDPSERPTTGRGATLAAVRRILTGEQYMTTYEPVEQEASISAELAAGLAENGEIPPDKKMVQFYNGRIKVPSIQLEPIAVTKDNLKRTVVSDGLIDPAQLCAGSVAQACRAAGITVE